MGNMGGKFSNKCFVQNITLNEDCIGRVIFARENEAGAIGGRKSIFSVLTYSNLFLVVIIELCVLFLVVITELFPISVFQLHSPKDYYKQKQWNAL